MLADGHVAGGVAGAGVVDEDFQVHLGLAAQAIVVLLVDFFAENEGDQIGVLVEVNCETDFVARTDDFKELVHDVAMHVAAADPRFVRKEDVTPEVIDGFVLTVDPELLLVDLITFTPDMVVP